jgi:hypothetical protein
MASEVKELLVKLTGDNKSLDAALDSSGSSLAVFARSAAGAAAAAAAAFGTLAVAQMGVIGRNEDMARSLGLSYGSLQKLSLIAGEGGVEIGQLSAALGLMQRAIVDSATTTNESLSVLGLSFENLAGLSPDEQFEKIGYAIAGINDPALQTSIAMDIFGRSGRLLIPTFEDLNAKIADADKFTKDFGIALSDVDAAKVGDAADAWGRVQLAVRGAANEMTVSLAPAIVWVSDKLVQAIGNAQKLANILYQIGKYTINYSNNRALKNIWMPTGGPSLQGAGPIEPANFEPFGPFSGGSLAGAPGLAAPLPSPPRTPSAKPPMARDAETTTKALESLTNKQDEVLERLDQTRTQAADAFSSFVSSVASGENAFQSLKRTAISALNDIVKEMFRISFTGRSSGGGLFSGIASGILGAFGGGSGLSSGAMSLMGGGKLFADGGVVSGATQFPIGYNTGIMGEKGPEAIMPLTRGANGKLGVAASGSGGGVTVVQNNNFALGVEQTARAEIVKMLPDIKKASVAAVQEAQSRGVI